MTQGVCEHVRHDHHRGVQLSNLPAEVTSFVGRRDEVDETRRLLSESRLVTLTGLGGVGKTRLALQVGALLRRSFSDGAWLVELADLRSPGLLASVMCSALRIGDRSAQPALNLLIDRLKDQDTLLILDNCEHLLDECASTIDTLLRSAPRLRVLATSRQALGVHGEQVLAVPTLSLPDSGDGAHRRRSSGEAVQLFAERARAVVSTFDVTEDNRADVEQICRRLDGVPLAIELAAVRLRVLSVGQLLDRLDDRFRLLTSGGRILPRHQTLRSLIDWSYALCTDVEKRLWERVSVFAGGLDLQAAEEVCADEGITREDAAAALTGLVDKSVLLRQEHDGVVRYRLLETIRQYGRERLEVSGDQASFVRRHRDHYRHLTVRFRAELFGPDQQEWFARLRIDHANLRAALEAFFATPETIVEGLDMASHLFFYWMMGDHFTEGRPLLEHALAAGPEPTRARARALLADSWLLLIQADPVRAMTPLRESREIGERLGIEDVLGYVMIVSGMIALYEGDVDAAVRYSEEAVRRHRPGGDLAGLSVSLTRLSLAYSARGDRRAIECAEEAVALSDRYGERWLRAYAQTALAVEYLRVGDPARAEALALEGLRPRHVINDPQGVGVSIAVLAWAAAAEGRHRRAAGLLGVLGTSWQPVGAPLFAYGHLASYQEECEATTRAALGDKAFRSAYDEGAALSYKDAIAFVMGERRSAATRYEGSLTTREGEIARLVAQGMSNRRIADALTISQRTVDGHVGRILTKLGLRSRTEVEAWVRSRDEGA